MIELDAATIAQFDQRLALVSHAIDTAITDLREAKAEDGETVAALKFAMALTIYADTDSLVDLVTVAILRLARE